MKKKIIILFILSFHIITLFSQVNMVRDGRFEEGAIEEQSTASGDGWFFLSVNDEESDKIAFGDEHQGTVAYISSTPHTNIFDSFIGQNIQGVMRPGIYRVSFSARSMTAENKAVLNIYLRIRDDSGKYKFFNLEKGCRKNGLPIAEIKLALNWEYYTIDFDLSEIIVVDNLNQPKQYDSLPSDETDLSNFYLAFSTVAPNVQIRFTDVSMSKVN